MSELRVSASAFVQMHLWDAAAGRKGEEATESKQGVKRLIG
jgi:hypothetical protein